MALTVATEKINFIILRVPGIDTLLPFLLPLKFLGHLLGREGHWKVMVEC
jgi:hypothetical protein